MRRPVLLPRLHARRGGNSGCLFTCSMAAAAEAALAGRLHMLWVTVRQIALCRAFRMHIAVCMQADRWPLFMGAVGMGRCKVQGDMLCCGRLPQCIFSVHRRASGRVL